MIVIRVLDREKNRREVRIHIVAQVVEKAEKREGIVILRLLQVALLVSGCFGKETKGPRQQNPTM